MLGTADNLMATLRNSHIQEKEQLDQLSRQVQDQFPDAKALAKELLKCGWLTLLASQSTAHG